MAHDHKLYVASLLWDVVSESTVSNTELSEFFWAR